MHTRKIKPAEEDRIEKGKRLACDLLVRRDEMDPQMAMDVVESMSAEDVLQLIVEANTAVMERVAGSETAPAAAPSAPATSPLDAPEDDTPAVDFLTIPELAAHETFSEQVVECVEANQLKNDSEKKYKSLKKAIIGILVPLKALSVEVFGTKLKVYKGNHRSLSDIKLLEKGVSIDIINQCWVDTPYDDVRITVPKEAK